MTTDMQSAMAGRAAAAALLLAATVPCYAGTTADVDKALTRVGKAVAAFHLVYEKPPQRLSDLWTHGFVQGLDTFLLPGSTTKLTTMSDIDTKGDFVLPEDGGTGEKKQLVVTRGRDGEPRRAYLADGTIISLPAELVARARDSGRVSGIALPERPSSPSPDPVPPGPIDGPGDRPIGGDAAEHNRRGNALFKQGKWREAILSSAEVIYAT